MSLSKTENSPQWLVVVFWRRSDLWLPQSWAELSESGRSWCGTEVIHPSVATPPSLDNVMIRGAPKETRKWSLKWHHGSLAALWFRLQGHVSRPHACPLCHCWELNDQTGSRHAPLAGGSQCFTHTHNKELHVHVDVHVQTPGEREYSETIILCDLYLT